MQVVYDNKHLFHSLVYTSGMALLQAVGARSLSSLRVCVKG